MGQSHSADEDPEGSARERFLENPTGKQHHTAPLLDGSCPFLELPISAMETICSLLPFSSLSSLSQTCSIMNSVVEEFLRHSCISRQLFDCQARFIAGSAGLMTPFEQQLSASIQAQLAAEGDLTRQDMFTLIHNMEYYKKQMIRVSLLDHRVHFPHRDNPDHVETFLEVQLSRNVVWVMDLREFFPLELKYSWQGIHPGVFQVAIRMKIGTSMGPHRDSYMTKFTLRWPGEEEEEVRVVVADRKWWDIVTQTYATQMEMEAGRAAGHVAGRVAGAVAGRMVGGIGAQMAGQVAGGMAGRVVGGKAVEVAGRMKVKFQQNKEDGLKVEWEEENGEMTGWARVEMSEVVVKGDGEISFLMKDDEPLGRAADLIFDFLELRKLR